MDKRLERFLEKLQAADAETRADGENLGVLQVYMRFYEEETKIKVCLEDPGKLGPHAVRTPIKNSTFLTAVWREELPGVTLIAYESQGESDPP